MSSSVSIFEQPIAPQCPWHNMYVEYGPANVKWCEERLCSWINEPANTWSNLGYLIVGFYLLFLAYKNKHRFDALFGSVIIFVGAMSLFYHATNNYLTQIVDFVGMFIYVFLMVCIGFFKLKILNTKQAAITYVSLIALGVLSIPVFRNLGIPYQVIVLMSGLTIAGTQTVIYRLNKKEYPLTLFLLTIMIFVIAAVFSSLDVTRKWCDPTNHYLQGHALWHLISAVAIYFSYRLFKRILTIELK